MSTLTIRIADDARQQLEAEALRRGVGLSTLVRELAESEARRVQREEVMAAWKPVMAHLASSELARVEVELYGTPNAEPV